MNVADDPHDRAIAAKRDGSTDWILAGKLLLRCRLVENDDSRSAIAVGSFEQAPAFERNPHVPGDSRRSPA